MCGRFNVVTSVQEFFDLLEILAKIDNVIETAPQYNIPPSIKVLVARCQSDNKKLEMVHLLWGIKPRWARNKSMNLINARAESLTSKPTFREAARHRRCLIAADGWYEWRQEGGVKHPYYISRQDKTPFFFAGLWEPGRRAADETDTADSCAIVTTQACESLRHIHTRMPVVLKPGLYERWLDHTLSTPQEIENVLAARCTQGFNAYPVSTFVNKPGNNSARCMAPAIVDAS